MTAFTPRQQLAGGPALDVSNGLGDEIPRWNFSQEIGVTGLRRTGGYVDDEFLPKLRGRRAVQVYREMTDNSAIVAAWINTVRQLLGQIEWQVEPASSSREDRDNAEFVEQNRDDMEHSWADFVSEVASVCSYGWSLHEMVFKRRQGLWATDPRFRSKYDDGRVGWRKFPIRAQETLLRWVFDEDSGDPVAMVQLAPPRYQTRAIPLGKSLLFRYLPNKNNPEGYSPLRPMYRPWFMLKRLEEIEAVGAERDLAGMPVAKVPAEYLLADKGTPQAATVENFKKMVQNVRRNEQDGLLIPAMYDPETKQPLFDFTLMSSGGSRQFNLDGIIQRYETRMLMAVLADFIMTGHEDSGASYALHTDKSGIFETGLNALANNVAEVLNRQAIPALFAVNGIKPKELPRFKPANVNPPNLAELASFMTALAGAGVQWFPDPVLEQFLRDAARLPQMDQKMERMEAAAQQQQSVINAAQRQLQMLQLQQQAAQGEMQMATQAQQLAGQQQALEAGPQEQGQPADPGDPDGKNAQAQAGESTKQAQLGTAQQKVKLDQEKAKLQNLRRPPVKAAARPPVKAAPAKATRGARR